MRTLLIGFALLVLVAMCSGCVMGIPDAGDSLARPPPPCHVPVLVDGRLDHCTDAAAIAREAGQADDKDAR